MINNLLVVDDSVVQLQHAVELCRSILPESDIRQCANGAEALDVLKDYRADVVVLDLEMPIMDGVTLASRIAAEKLAKAIVICSSKDPLLIASVGIMSETSGLQVLGMLQKPLKVESLRESFNKLDLSRSQAYLEKKDYSDIGEQDLLQALSNKEFRLHFQPKLAAKGLLIKGVEALARWRHSRFGPVPPPVFIDIAERCNAIDQLTFHFLEMGIAFIKSCEARGLKLNVAFNLSPSSVSREGFGDKLEALFNNANIHGKKITLEITENLLLGDVPNSLRQLASLRLKGFSVSIDDFGTGFANAEQLVKLPATELKLDRSLVHGASSKWQQREILESTVKLAKRLNLNVVAEGVEEMADYHLLKEMDVDYIQGFLFAKPMDEDELFRWVREDLRDIRKKMEAP